MSIERTTAGKLVDEDFDSMPAGPPIGWSDLSQADADFVIVADSSKFNEANHGVVVGDLNVSGNCRLIRDALLQTTDYVLQAFIDIGPLTNNSRPGLVCRWGGGGVLVSAYASFHSGSGTLEREGLWLDAGDGGFVHAALNLIQGDYYVIQLEVEGLLAKARLFSFAGAQLATLNLPTPAAPNSTSQVGVRGIGNTVAQLFWDRFRVFTSTSVTVVDLPTGWKARAGGILAAEDGSGTATIQLAGQVFPIAGDLEILDASDVVQETITPTDGIWGGDVYTFVVDEVWTEVPPPATNWDAAATPATATEDCEVPITAWEEC